MKTLSVQQMPNGYELETPSFGYWVKAGIGFAIGGGIAAICWGLIVVSLFFGFGLTGLLLRSAVAAAPTHMSSRR